MRKVICDLTRPLNKVEMHKKWGSVKINGKRVVQLSANITKQLTPLTPLTLHTWDIQIKCD